MNGFLAVFRGVALMFRPGLKRFIWIPILVNSLLLIGIAWAASSYFGVVLDQLLPQDSWLSWFRWLLWPLFAIAYGLFVFYGFTALANIIASPFNSLLAARIESMLANQPLPQDNTPLLASVLPALLMELRKLGYFLIRAIPVLILFLIPGINVVATVLWLLLGFWFLALEYLDYPLGNHGLTFAEQKKLLASRRVNALGFGAGVSLLMFIPILNLAAMPVAVAGATLLWHDQLRVGRSVVASPSRP